MDDNGLGAIIDIGCGCGLPILLLLLGFTVGALVEKAHLKRLAVAEAELAGIVMCSVGRLPDAGPQGSPHAQLVVTEVMISSDYFKTFIATLIKLLGGELRTYRSLMERARREALVRLARQARDAGCDLVCNIRIETADLTGAAISAKKNPIVAVGVIASGTAVRRGVAPQTAQ